jgi:hypothetical protein
MYFKEGEATLEATKGFKIALTGLTVLVVLLGLFPELLLYWYYF